MNRAPTTLLTDVEVEGVRVDVLLRQGVVRRIGARLRGRTGNGSDAAVDDVVDDVVDGAGGALLPGLHDHHLHLLSWAASLRSVSCGPPAVRTVEQLARALRSARPGPVRGIGYHESVAGDLDRRVLDRLLADRPVRVQHRSGGLWTLNSAALALLPDVVAAASGAERDATGELTGRLWRLDGLLPPQGPDPDLAPVRDELAATGVTGVTDATPDPTGAGTSALLAAAARAGLPAQVVLLGPVEQPPALPRRWCLGPRKLLLPDHDLPALDELSSVIADTHRAGRAVAVHCVTRESLLLTVVALQEAGPQPGDRIEHAAVVPAEVRPALRRLGVTVVTQPALLAGRGDAYRDEVHADDLPLLYPWRSLAEAGVPVVGSSDAPFGPSDPWRVIACARDRQAGSGVTLGPDERVPTRAALSGYLRAGLHPGGGERRVRPGAPADLVLLHTPLAAALRAPTRDAVRRVWHAVR